VAERRRGEPLAQVVTGLRLLPEEAEQGILKRSAKSEELSLRSIHGLVHRSHIEELRQIGVAGQGLPRFAFH
jgi:hypothetical protein